MIVVLCNSFEDAQDCYDMFVSFLENFEPFSIKKTYNSSYCIETDDDLRYIFVDYRFKPLFYNFDKPDIIEADEFFEGICEFVDC